MKVQISISLGELVDKISILKIKENKITSTDKLILVKEELGTLEKELQSLKLQNIEIYLQELLQVNTKLWDIEDDIRALEKGKRFDDQFISLARSVYITNDQRFDIKNKINHDFNSQIKEVKSYEEY